MNCLIHYRASKSIFAEAALYPDLHPAVGDFVMVNHTDSRAGNAIIQHTLKRKSAFARTAVSLKGHIQIIAATIDNLFICMALNADYTISRLERYLSMARDSGAVPVIILTKSDVCTDMGQLSEA